MKRYLVGSALCLLALSAVGIEAAEAQQRTGAAAPATQGTRFAFINSQKILAEAPGAREAQQTFEREMQRFRTEVDSLEQQLEQMRVDLERQQATLSPQVRQQRQEAMQQQFTTYQSRLGELERTAQRRQTELVEPIMQRISETIEEMRREGNYGMIFDASAGALITADPSLDLTDRVIARLRQTAGR
jgi:outer membrane protein